MLTRFILAVAAERRNVNVWDVVGLAIAAASAIFHPQITALLERVA